MRNLHLKNRPWSSHHYHLNGDHCSEFPKYYIQSLATGYDWCYSQNYGPTLCSLYYLKLWTSIAYISAENPWTWDNKWDIANPKDDSRQVYGTAADTEISRYDVTDDGKLDPVHGIAAGTQHKYCQHNPAPFVLPELSRDSWLLCLHCCECCTQVLWTGSSIQLELQE